MSHTLIPLFMIAVFIAMIGLAVWAGIRQGKKAEENVRQMAASLGLQMGEVPTGLAALSNRLRASGIRRGRRMEIFSFATGSGKSRTHWSAVSVAAPAAGGLSFHLQRQGFGTKFIELFGAKEITVGDPEFDRAWFIQTNRPELFGAALLPEVREKISTLLRESGTKARGMAFKLEGNAVRYAEIGSFADNNLCQRCLQAADIIGDLADAAEVVAGSAR